MINAPRSYDIEFGIACFSAESPVFALLAMLPMIKSFRFKFEDILDDKWREIEHVLASIGVNLVHTTKVPHVEEEEEPKVKNSEKTPEKVNPKLKAGLLFDELLSRRDMIYEASRSKDVDQAELKKNKRDYDLTVDALINEIAHRIIDNLEENEEEDNDSD